MATNAIKPAQGDGIQADHRRTMKAMIQGQELNNRIKAVWSESAGPFLASVLDLYTSDSNLIQCDPAEVMQEAMKAAVLHLPVVKSLGFAYVVPFKDKSGQQHPNFVLGYKGLVQLAMRTGHYRTINAGEIYEGETVKQDRITGDMSIEGVRTGDKAIGYFAHFSLINGFRKTVYWTREQVVKHAKTKSRSFSSSASPWQTDFDAMAEKTLLRHLLTKYGELSVDMVQAQTVEDEDMPETESAADLPPIVMDAAPISEPEELLAADSPQPTAAVPEDDGCPF